MLGVYPQQSKLQTLTTWVLKDQPLSRVQAGCQKVDSSQAGKEFTMIYSYQNLTQNVVRKFASGVPTQAIKF